MNEEPMNEKPMNEKPMNETNATAAKQPVLPRYENETVQKIVENFPVFGLTSLLYGLFFCFCLYKNMYSYTSLLLCIATIAYFTVCFRKLEITTFKTRFFYIVCICLLGLSNMLTANPVIIFLNYAGILLLLFCFLIRHFYDTSEWDFSKYTSALLQTIFCSVGRLDYPFKSFAFYYRNNRKLKNSKLIYVLIGLCISVPLLLIVCALLLSADVVFRDLTGSFLQLFDHVNFGTMIGITITILIGLTFSYGILVELSAKIIQPEAGNKKTMEPIIAITFTSVLSVVYIIFSVIQILYLFIGNMSLPDHYTYAQYAREGFFQLLFVCMINLILVVFCMLHYRDNRVLKAILTIICGCTYIMIASSTMRMLLYIQNYYLTFLRVFVLLALFVLFLCLTGVVISIFKPEFPLFTYMLVIVSVCYICFSLSRPDSYIASYNIAAGNTDMDYLLELSTDAVPALMKCEEFSDDNGYGSTSSDVLLYKNHCEDLYESMNLRRFNLSVYIAGQTLNF